MEMSIHSGHPQMSSTDVSQHIALLTSASGHIGALCADALAKPGHDLITDFKYQPAGTE